MRRSSPTLRARRQFSLAVCLLAGSTAAVAANGASLASEAKFSNLFLRQSPGEQIDVSRFKQGNAALAGSYHVDLYVNQGWIGRTDVSLRAVDGDGNVQPCFDRALLERMGVDLTKLKPEAVAVLQDGTAACRSLQALIDEATATFDNGEQRLDVSVPQAAMFRQARGYVDPKNWDEGINAARLQYNVNVYHSDSQGLASTQGYLGLDAGVNMGPWRFHHRGSFTRDQQTGNHYQSVQTNLQRSIVPLKSQLVIGEAFTDGTLFDSVGFRGVQLASDDRMYPESQRGYAPTVRGIAQSNARVQIRQNGNILYETTVAAGPFEINDLYPTGYGGDLEVSVTEADGTLHVSRVPYAAAVNALRPGVTRYSATAGQYRNAGTHITPPLVQGAVQHGFTNLVTGYGGFVASPHYVAGLVGAALTTEYGAFGVDITQANTWLASEPSRSGQSVRLSYSKLVQPTNTNLTLAAYRYSSGGYLGLADAMTLRDLEERGATSSTNGIQRGKLQLTVNQNLRQGWGNLYLSGSVRGYWNRDDHDTQLQAGYNNSYKRINYGVSVSRQLNITTSQWDNRMMLNVGIPLGKNPHAPYSTISLQHDSSGSASLQEAVTGTLGKDSAMAYGINVGHNRGNGTAASTSVAGNASYASPVATLSASASKSSTYMQVSAGMTGGIVAYSGGVAFTPSLGDTLAVVEASDAAGARLANGSGLRVDPWGHAVVSGLTPFARNQVEIDPQGLPMNVELKSTMQQVAPTAGAVVKLKFDTENVGRTAILEVRRAGGELLPFGAEVRDASGQAVGTVAQGGRILARGLKADSGTLSVVLGVDPAPSCKLSYQLPRDQTERPASVTLTQATCVE